MKVSRDGDVSMTFDDYDMYIDSAKNCGYKISSEWYPNMESAKRLVEHFADNVQFAIWILESNAELVLNEEQKLVRNFLYQAMLKNLKLCETA